MRRFILAIATALALPALAGAQSTQTITPPIIIGPQLIRDNTASTTTLDATGEYVAAVLPAPSTCTIDRIHYYATTVTANGDGLRVRIETVSATDGNPTGTLFGSGSEVTVTTTTANSWNRSPAGLGAAVTKGDIIAVKLTSPASGTTFNGIIRYAFANGLGPGVTLSGSGQFPYIVQAVPTATKAVSGLLDLAIECSDGTTPPIVQALPLSGVTSTNFNSTSTPDERANYFTPNIPLRVIGLCSPTVNGGANQSYDAVLYDASNTAQRTISVDLDQDRGTAGGRCHLFSSAYSLTANTAYRIAVKPTVTTNITAQHWTIDTSAGGTRIREAAMGGLSWRLSTRTDGATTGGTLGDGWTQTDDSVASIALLVDGLSDGVCSGGGPCVVR